MKSYCVDVKSNRKTIYRARVIEEMPVQIAIMRCDRLGIPDIHRIVTALLTSDLLQTTESGNSQSDISNQEPSSRVTESKSFQIPDPILYCIVVLLLSMAKFYNKYVRIGKVCL